MCARERVVNAVNRFVPFVGALSRSMALLQGVVFDNWFARLFGSSREGNYWILDLDPAYSTALVGTPDRRYLWILARAPRIDDDTYDRLVQLARGFGYPVEDLVRDLRP